MLTRGQVKGKVFDHLGLIACVLRRVGLIEKIDARLPVQKEKGAKVTMGERVAAMILNGLGFIDDRLYLFPEFLANKPVDRLFRNPELKAEYFNDDALGRALDAIYEYGETKLFTEIAFEIGVEQKLLGTSVHFDNTSLMVHGEYESSPENGSITITHGYSKEKRFDLKQMVLNLATTGAANFPIWMEAHNGNASDKVVLHQAAERMQTFCQALKDAPSFLYVGDSAFYEHAVCDRSTMKWLTRVPETIKEARNLVEGEPISWEDLGRGYRISTHRSSYGGVEQQWVLVESQQACERESKTRDKKIEEEKDRYQRDLWHLSCREFECQHDAEQAVREATHKLKYHVVTFVVEEVKKHAAKGRPKRGVAPSRICYRIHAQLSPNHSAINRMQRSSGRFILSTNDLDRDPKTLLDEYKKQSGTEGGFRFIKGDALEVSSVFLKKTTRIQALMMIMVLCLMVYALAQHQLRQALEAAKETLPNQNKKPTATPTMTWIFRLFHGVQVIEIELPDKIQVMVINLTPVTEKVLRLMGIDFETTYGIAA